MQDFICDAKVHCRVCRSPESGKAWREIVGAPDECPRGVPMEEVELEFTKPTFRGDAKCKHGIDTGEKVDAKCNCTWILCSQMDGARQSSRRCTPDTCKLYED